MSIYPIRLSQTSSVQSNITISPLLRSGPPNFVDSFQKTFIIEPKFSGYFNKKKAIKAITSELLPLSPKELFLTKLFHFDETNILKKDLITQALDYYDSWHGENRKPNYKKIEAKIHEGELIREIKAAPFFTSFIEKTKPKEKKDSQPPQEEKYKENTAQSLRAILTRYKDFRLNNLDKIDLNRLNLNYTERPYDRKKQVMTEIMTAVFETYWKEHTKECISLNDILDLNSK
jgi:hypothetical protein